MKLGINSAILEHYDFEEMIKFASLQGFECVEVACWPVGKAERRYAGVSHIDVSNLDDRKVNEIHDICKKYNIEISALAFYPNTLDSDLEARENNISHLKKVIDAAALLDVNLVTTFIGRMQEKTIEENIIEFSNVWPSIIQYAKQRDVRIAIENCPMLFSQDEWPGGKNIFTSPAIWRELFKIIPDENFGINYDPSHFVWQQMDYIKPIYEFKDRIFHIHFKDIKLSKDALDDYGVLAYPLSYMTPKLPGLGDVDWGKYVSALTDIGYKGYACIEVEDKAFESSNHDIDNSVILSYRYLRQFVI
ncbi:sugar phosphate isomerase/epimerase family protein [Breznakia pachnodae]|uniref:Sugar phosphate isomerase/epimerase n=1 Tax=Breznakia pachnodae TaxID=265178 RepID=A0ABU0E1Z6_9FIRM|nr:sugar phosphate isomerase/epimerase [Breznakia pachnodae]MDQ0360741.1 sugar phosphate isomerase/epimerase [Breznakia pachnodae]